jgi:hypothetical protein
VVLEHHKHKHCHVVVPDTLLQSCGVAQAGLGLMQQISAHQQEFMLGCVPP